MRPLVIESLEQAKEAVRSKLRELGSPKVCFVGQRASDIFIFKDLIPVGAVLCLDFGKDAEILEKELPLISFEKDLGVRGQWYSRQLSLLFEDKNLEQKIDRLLPPGSIAIPYSVFGELERFCQEKKLKLLGPKEKVKEKLENKRFVFELRRELKLPSAESRLLDVKDAKYKDLVDDFGKKFIIQRFNGSSGSGTDVIENEKQFNFFKAKLEANERVVVSDFINGPTISLNGVVTPRGAYFFCPSLQVIGNGETAPRATIFSGVDYAAVEAIKNDVLPERGGSGFPALGSGRLFLSASSPRTEPRGIRGFENKEKLLGIAQKVADLMRQQGFLGIFNLNLMANGLVVTDINPRFMGSGQLTTEMQIEQDEVPLALLHLMVFLGIDFVLSEKMKEKIFSPKEGSFIVLHSLEKKKRTVRGDLPIGIFSFNNGKLAFVKEAVQFKEIKRDSEVLIAGSVPQKGKMVEPEAPILRIFTREAVLDPKNFKLNRRYRSLCKQVYNKLNL